MDKEKLERLDLFVAIGLSWAHLEGGLTLEDQAEAWEPWKELMEEVENL